MKKLQNLDRKTLTTSALFQDMEHEVQRRYGRCAGKGENGLCCPVEYDENILSLLPQEIVEKDYGCGDPSRYVYEGESVIDLGSGSGKACYMISQKVGPGGEVIGVDFNDEMLVLSRKYIEEMASKIGYRNVKFVKGKIQDLALDLEKAQEWLQKHPIMTVEQLSLFEAECERIRCESPLIKDSSVDVVVSNCVLNLVRPEDKCKLFSEIYRVLRRGGRAVISDIVCDEDPTPAILSDPVLWSGCIAGAFREDRFVEMFEQAGFYGIEILTRTDKPWRIIDGIEFRSVTVQAFKGKEGRCIERNQAVIYKGPWKSVCDDDGHMLYRGQRMAVCDKTFSIMTNPSGPYAHSIIGVLPIDEVTVDDAPPYDCNRLKFRHPRETKGLEYSFTSSEGEDSCCRDSICDG